MKTFILISLIIGIMSTVFAQKNVSYMNLTEQEVFETVRQWNQAFDQNDPKQYFFYIHENLTIFLASSPYRIDGKMDDIEEFEWSLQSGRTRVSLFQELQPRIHLLSETSALVTYHTSGLYGGEGNESMVYLKETNVLVKENGQWKIMHIHIS